MKKYYGFNLWDGKNTTTGYPNERTGRMSIAGDIEVFKTKKARDEWADNYKQIAIKRSELRNYLRGMSINDMNEYIDMIIYIDED